MFKLKLNKSEKIYMKSVFSIFKRGLQKTATSVARSVGGVFSDVKAWDESTYEDLEAALLSADFGTETTFKLVEDLRDRYKHGQIKTSEEARNVVAADVLAILQKNTRVINIQENGLTVIFLVGVNGSGKTTTAGKLASQWKNDGKTVMLAACDTFRAAAVEQLKLWGERIDCPVVASKTGADPSSVTYDAIESAKAKGLDMLLVDTAGRQHNKKGLMEELAKMKRTAEKVLPGAPHEVWLTIDAGIGTNALNQAKEFAKVADVTGLILTKLDGTGKGGMAVAIQQQQPLPVLFAGFGEQAEDLQPFDPEMFTEAIFGTTESSNISTQRRKDAESRKWSWLLKACETLSSVIRARQARPSTALREGNILTLYWVMLFVLDPLHVFGEINTALPWRVMLAMTGNHP